MRFPYTLLCTSIIFGQHLSAMDIQNPKLNGLNNTAALIIALKKNLCMECGTKCLTQNTFPFPCEKHTGLLHDKCLREGLINHFDQLQLYIQKKIPCPICNKSDAEA